MTTAAATHLSADIPTSQRLRVLFSSYSDLSKSRLTMLVVLTAIVGFVMASAPIDWFKLALLALGVALAAASANCFNEYLERHRDLLMPRTQNRPLPANRISPAHALAFATLTAILGLAILYRGVNPLSAALAAANIFLYVCIYTPLKVRTTLNTLIGAIVGAIPPMIGWAGATNQISTGAYVLAAILFAWQMPHFLALAWMYRDQYQRAGFRMLPAIDPTGRLTCATALLYSLSLLPIALAATLTGITGILYAVGSILLGAWMVFLAVALLRNRTQSQARKLFLASVIYLPLLMGLMIYDRLVPHDIPAPSTTIAQPADIAG